MIAENLLQVHPFSYWFAEREKLKGLLKGCMGRKWRRSRNKGAKIIQILFLRSLSSLITRAFTRVSTGKGSEMRKRFSGNHMKASRGNSRHVCSMKCQNNDFFAMNEIFSFIDDVRKLWFPVKFRKSFALIDFFKHISHENVSSLIEYMMTFRINYSNRVSIIL